MSLPQPLSLARPRRLPLPVLLLLFVPLLLSLVPPLSALAASAPAPDLYVSSGATVSVLRFNGASGAAAGSFGVGSAPSGVAFGPDGALYAASNGGGSVVRYDPKTGATSTFVAANAGGLSGPLGLRFGPDGNLYVAAGGGVFRYNGTTGAFVDIFVGPGGVGYDLAFGPDGNLYVASGSRVLRFNGKTGAFLDTFIPNGGGGLIFATTLAFGPDGNLYVASRSGVLRFSGTTGAFLNTAAPNGGAGLADPFGIAFGPDGDLYVTSNANPSGATNYSVLRFDPATGASRGVFASLNSQPNYLTFGPISAAPPAGARELITNGGFEVGGLSGWTVTNEAGSNGSYFAESATPAPPLYPSQTVGPASGAGYAASAENGPAASALTQTFTVPAGAAKVTLSYDMFVNDYSGNGPVLGAQGLEFNGGPNQRARVDLLTSSASPLSTASADVLRNFYDGVDSHAVPNPHAYTHYTFDITGQVGEGGAYTLRFAQVDNQSFLVHGIDNVSVQYTPAPPPAPLTLSVSPGTVTGGDPASATLTLNSPAVPGPDPSGEGLGGYGAIIRLDAAAPLQIGNGDNGGYVFRGSGGTTYVLVPTGRTTTNLRLCTSAVSAPTAATLTATYGGGSTSTTLTINPVQVKSLSLSPADVPGGGQSTATVTLNAPAVPGPDPSGTGQGRYGAVIRLDSDSAAAAFTRGFTSNGGILFRAADGHFYLFIPQGQTAASFSVTTNLVPADTRATLSATLNGASQTGTLTIQAVAPTLSFLSPDSGAVGGAAFPLAASGTGFLPNSVIDWNGQARPTHYVSPTQLVADIPASDLASVGTASVTVAGPSGVTASLPFTVGVPRLSVTARLSRDAPTGEIVALVSVTNTGSGPASAVRLSTGRLGTAPASSLPDPLGDLYPGATATLSVRFPAPAGGAGAVAILRLSGVYATGSFLASQRVTLP